MYRYFLQNKQAIPVLKQRKDFVGPIKGTVMEQQYREVPESLLSNPSRLADPDLVQVGKPTFLRIGEGNEPRNELLRIVKQYPSKDEVRTKVLGEIFPPTDKDPYFNRPDNIAALRIASEELGIPIERTGLRIATHPFRLEGDVADVNLLAQITNRAASNLQRQGSPVLANALSRKAQFFNQPRSYRELAIDGSEGIDSIIAAYEKAEPRVTANSQGNRPILMQADGLDPNVGILSGSPENIPPMDIEGLRGTYAYKPADEMKRPRFIDMGYDVYTRSGNPINAEQKNLLDMGMADLEDRNFILRDPASVNSSEQYRPTTTLGLQTLGLNADIGRETIAPSVEIGDTLYPSNSTIVRRSIPINRLTDDLSDRVLSGEIDLRNYEPFKSNRNTYGATQGKTPWREYYSDPFIYEDKGIDNEVNRLVRAVNEAPAQLENAYIQQANANRRASNIQDTINVVRRMGRGTTTPQSDAFSLGINPELVVKPTSLFNSLKKDRRMAEIDASKAQDRIAELKAAQELLGVEYMAKPKTFSPEVLEGYRIASRDKGAIKDSGYNEQFSDYPYKEAWHYFNALGDKTQFQLANNIPLSFGLDTPLENYKFNKQYSEPDRDYDIASAFGFAGNY